MPIKGLDEFTRKIKELEKAAAALDGDLTSVGFDPSDPQSIELAIQQMEDEVDKRVGSLASNEIVSEMASQLKERARAAILEKAERARVAGEGDHDA